VITLAVCKRSFVLSLAVFTDILCLFSPPGSSASLGLLAMATRAYSTLLAIPGRKIGHVQLVHLPECIPPEPLGPPTGALPQPPPAPTKHPVSMIVAHETALSTLSVPPSGKLIATTSARGTLVRVWDTVTGNRLRELRRGSDQAEIYGVAFRPDEQELCVWSDKGTVHVFSLVSGSGASYVLSLFQPCPLELMLLQKPAVQALTVHTVFTTPIQDIRFGVVIRDVQHPITTVPYRLIVYLNSIAVQRHHRGR